MTKTILARIGKPPAVPKTLARFNLTGHNEMKSDVPRHDDFLGLVASRCFTRAVSYECLTLADPQSSTTKLSIVREETILRSASRLNNSTGCAPTNVKSLTWGYFTSAGNVLAQTLIKVPSPTAIPCCFESSLLCSSLETLSHYHPR